MVDESISVQLQIYNNNSVVSMKQTKLNNALSFLITVFASLDNYNAVSRRDYLLNIYHNI